MQHSISSHQIEDRIGEAIRGPGTWKDEGLPDCNNVQSEAEGEQDKGDAGCLSFASRRLFVQSTLLNPGTPKLFIDYRIA